MLEVDTKQTYLDAVEKQFLTDIFGGYTADNFVIRIGLFKFDMSNKVQKVINSLEDKIKPFMNDNGEVNLTELKHNIGLSIFDLPDGEYCISDIYKSIQPLVLGLKEYILGVK